MKVLLCVRQDYYRNFASDSMQVMQVAKYLKKLGVTFEINNGETVDYSSYDIIHLFNLNSTGEIYKYYKIAHHYRKTIVVSPNYWDLSRYYDYVGDIEGLKLWRRCKPYRDEILKKCNMIFCNSNIEKEHLKKEFAYIAPCKIVHYGVNAENDDIPLYNFKERYMLDKYILCVGRICEIKNQYVLAKVCSEMGIELILIGNVEDRKYFKKCMRFKNVKYFGFMDSYNIYNAYRFAKVHVNCSFAEMPGLSSLEAAASGCTVVSTEEGCSYEYFKDMAIYNDPYDEEDIFNAINMGLQMKKSTRLKNYIANNFSWEKYCGRIYEYYVQLL
ncbi:glycosyl transferases group 1 [Clostridium tepidiprofundi DSM 19306]|uniref:Glycosyl transferases group 1 n=1 Tax=Clostridium tepidiprofundi DSM 19306 TaxID=1121338 RepID=A0A151ATU0_9CLOT|nr:glycosyltransferase [Clostridium tepidiprofundi]KYH31058.1 glycosyl transferases group 1 [Clostridium tepidiprofundi DSM 19306]